MDSHSDRESLISHTDREIKYFRSTLREWFATNGRDFPWRKTADPYAVLIAEMMLQRTQARQVVQVYLRFLEQFPTIEQLASAAEEDVGHALYSLGLAWRQKHFRRIAEAVVEYNAGGVPEESEELLRLPGVGDYVKSAVRCFAFHRAEVLIDTNTVRVAGRFFGFPTGPESRRKQDVRAAVTELVDPNTPRESNLALLDFAALICMARNPRCGTCPVRAHCRTFTST
jgi:A/G-specific adenine glycosylase